MKPCHVVFSAVPPCMLLYPSMVVSCHTPAHINKNYHLKGLIRIH